MKENFNADKVLKEIFEIDAFKNLNEYLKSDENIQACKQFEELKDKYILLQKQYGDSFNELNKDVELRAYRREYSKGGLGYHRGYYSPSNMDLVMGGVNRGKLIRKSEKSKYNYEYVFDINNRLICVYTFNQDIKIANDIELFIYEKEKVKSLVYRGDDHALSFITECLYENDHLFKYESSICDLCYGGKGCTEINVEVNSYENDLLKSTTWYRYNPSVKILTHYGYSFSRDSEGLLSTYKVEQLGRFVPQMKEVSSEQIYKVRVKRK